MFPTSFPFLLSLSSISIAAVNAIAFNAPIATPILLQAYADTTGWTPIPTTNPQSLLELFRRQAQADPGLCGYIKGDPESPISCDVGSCMFNADLKWFGCCTGSAPGDCDLQTACVEAKSAERCRADSACASDKSVLFCTDPQAPSCALFLTTTSGDAQKTHSHWVCGASPTNLALYPTPSLHSSDDINNIAALTANGDKPFYVFDTGERKTETQIQGSTTTNGAAAVKITPTPSTVSASVTVQGGVSASRSTGGAAALGSGRTGEVVLTVGVVVIGVGVLFG